MIKSGKNDNWDEYESLIRRVLNNYANLLKSDSVDFVQHYIDHNELEMAFEGFFLELIGADIEFDENDKKNYLKLGRDLGLDKTCVFDDEFWEKFLRYIKND